MAQAPLSIEVLTERMHVYAQCIADGHAPYGASPREYPKSKGAVNAAAEQLGLRWQSMRDTLLAATKAGVTVPSLPVGAVPAGFEMRGLNTSYNADGSVARQTVRSAPALGGKFEPLPGQVVKGESALVDPEGRIVAKWVKTREDAVGSSLVDAMTAALAEGARAERVAAPELVEQDTETFYPLPDLHFGMMAWGKETGEAFDLTIAARNIRAQFDALIEQSRPSGRALIAFLGDVFHTNDQSNMTVRSKHVLDVDGRFPKILQVGCMAARYVIDRALEKHDKVHVIVIRGNHDNDSASALHIALKFYYERDPRFTINDYAKDIEYDRFGVSLRGFNHGHLMKPDAAAHAMAADVPQDWAAAKLRRIYSGHIHHGSVKTVGSVKCESFSTPIPRDAYAASGGYRSERTLTAITFHRTLGEIGRHQVNVG